MLDREEKIMSRNKDIKLLHEITGWSYKECRKRMKANHWKISKVLGGSFDLISEIISNALNVMRRQLTFSQMLVKILFVNPLRYLVKHSIKLTMFDNKGESI